MPTPLNPVLALHASGLSGRQWRKLSDRLAPRPVLAPDLLGYGATPPWDDARPFSLDAELDALAPHLHAAYPHPVHLVGHSYGGLLALLLALRHPQAVASITVHEPVVWAVLHATASADFIDANFNAINHDGRFFDPAFGDTEAWMARFINFWSGPGAWDATPPPARAAMLDRRRKTFLEVRALCFDQTPLATLATLTHPTRVLLSQHAPPAAAHVCRTLASLLPNAHLTPVPGGHMAPLTHPQPVLDAIADHIHTHTHTHAL